MSDRTWLPWTPTAEPSREECEALIGRRVRVDRVDGDWMTVCVIGVRSAERLDVLCDGVPMYQAPWLWPTDKPHAPWVVREIEVRAFDGWPDVPRPDDGWMPTR